MYVSHLCNLLQHQGVAKVSKLNPLGTLNVCVYTVSPEVFWSLVRPIIRCL